MAEHRGDKSAFPVISLEITQERLNAYAAASGDSNPLHWEADFAASTQFGGIIAHGMLTLALVSQMLAAAYGRDWLVSGSLRVRFRGAAYLGDVVESRGTVSREEDEGEYKKITCSVSVVNRASGDDLVTGTATVKVTAN